MFHRAVPNTNAKCHEFKFGVTLATAPAGVFALAKECDLAPTWNPFVQQGALISYTPPTPSTAARLKAYIEIALPWPIPNLSLAFR